MTSVGFCANPNCARAVTKEAIERYPGPGEYCPTCGNELSGPRSAPAVKRRSLLPWIPGALVICGVCCFAIWQWITLTVNVCATTMTSGLAGTLLSAYRASHSAWPYHFRLASASDGACDVRFYVAKEGDKSAVIARDAVVAIVNPANPIGRLTMTQIRAIVSGRATDWSQLGGRHAAIAVAAPLQDSDETRQSELLFGKLTAPQAQRMTAEDVVAFVTSPAGRGAIGFVPFSASLAAKVVALAGSPQPSTLSIAEEGYPLTVRVMVGSDFRHPSSKAAGFIDFARSKEASGLIARSAFVTRDGI